MKSKYELTFLPTLLAVHFLLTLKLAYFLNPCTGQHYFFEEIKEVNSTTDSDDLEAERRNHTDKKDPFISFENATLMQDDEPQGSFIESIKFPDFYHAQGIISLPYDGIIEPFEAWFAGRHQMSRIDYYYGNQKPFIFVLRLMCRYYIVNVTSLFINLG